MIKNDLQVFLGILASRNSRCANIDHPLAGNDYVQGVEGVGNQLKLERNWTSSSRKLHFGQLQNHVLFLIHYGF